jgi:hypothetical protein
MVVPVVLVRDGVQICAGANRPGGAEVDVQIGHVALKEGRANLDDHAKGDWDEREED